MKKLVVVIILATTQFALAQRAAVEVRALSRHEARQKIENNESYKKITEKAKTGQKLEANETRFLQKAVSMYTKDAGVTTTTIHQLVTLKPELLADVIKLSSVVADKNSKSDAVVKAKSDLEVLEIGARQVDVNSPKAKEDAETISKLAELPDYNKEAKDFRTNLIKELESGKSLDEAITVASKGKITKEKLTACEI